MLDVDLAALYDVETKMLKQTVRRNQSRFPSDFLFELTKEEYAKLQSQFATANVGRGGARYLPFAFTEQGVAMLSGILNSERAISVNIAIMRTFVQMRKLMFSNAELSQRVSDLEKLTTEHLDDYSGDIQDIYEALRQMMRTQEYEGQPRRTIGF